MGLLVLKPLVGIVGGGEGDSRPPRFTNPTEVLCVPAGPGGTGKMTGTAANNLFLQRLIPNPPPPTVTHAYEPWALGVAWSS